MTTDQKNRSDSYGITYAALVSEVKHVTNILHITALIMIHSLIP